MRSMIMAVLLVTSGVALAQYAPPPPAGGRRVGPPPGAPLEIPQGWGRLRNRAQNMCLDVAGWSMKGNRNVLLWECNGDPDHQWSFSPGGELLNAVGSVCLDAAGYDGRAGANVGVFRCENQDDQRWNLVARGRGTFELRNRKQNMCLDVVGSAGNRGDNVILWPCDGGLDQVWAWEPAGAPPPAPVYVPAPPPSYPPPPPPAGPIAMDPGTFSTFLNALRNESFSDGKARVIGDAAGSNWFTIAQLKQVINVLTFSSDKIRAVELIAPRIVDRQNSFTLYDAFTFDSDKRKAREILDRTR
jgi:hypothetical protein